MKLLEIEELKKQRTQMNANERKLKAKELLIISTLSAEIHNNSAWHTNTAYKTQINICVHLRSFAFSVSFEN
jgi:hypothetical protein